MLGLEKRGNSQPLLAIRSLTLRRLGGMVTVLEEDRSLEDHSQGVGVHNHRQECHSL